MGLLSDFGPLAEWPSSRGPPPPPPPFVELPLPESAAPQPPKYEDGGPAPAPLVCAAPFSAVNEVLPSTPSRSLGITQGRSAQPGEVIASRALGDAMGDVVASKLEARLERIEESLAILVKRETPQ